MISLIMPVLNEGERIGPALEALEAWPEIEVIVVDGGSTDHTVSIAEQTAKVLVSKPGRGIQMNAGAREAQGDILWFVHADTTLPPDGPTHVQAAIDKGCIGGAFSSRFDETNAFWDLILWFDNHRTRIFNIYFGSRAMFVDAGVFRALGGFPEIPFLEDVAFSRLLRKAGKSVMLEAVALESFRRFRKSGPLRQLLLDMVLLGAFELGVSSERLAKFYKDIR